jgi:hypothetical protein
MAVSCSARLNCWAVGSATLGSTKQEPIAEHWNGRKWSLTVLPEPARQTADVLFGVWCPGGTRCWAVGSAARRVGVPSRPLAEHWTGRKWTVAATPSTGGGLGGVWCPGKGCLATGNGGFPSAIAERWNGKKWSLTQTASLPSGAISGLPSVSCATSINCFAVGLVNTKTLIERWRGSKWARVKNPIPVGAKSSALRSVFCLPQGACWAVGESAEQASGGKDRTLVEHWNGRRWSIVRTP